VNHGGTVHLHDSEFGLRIAIAERTVGTEARIVDQQVDGFAPFFGEGKNLLTHTWLGKICDDSDAKSEAPGNRRADPPCRTSSSRNTWNMSKLNGAFRRMTERAIFFHLRLEAWVGFVQQGLGIMTHIRREKPR